MSAFEAGRSSEDRGTSSNPERDCDVDITVLAHYNLGDEDEALERLAEVYEDVWRQIQWTREQG